MTQPNGGQDDAALPQAQQETAGSFRAGIRQHMEVVSADGAHIGTVDSIEGDEIKLTASDSPDGKHAFVPLSLVDAVEPTRVVVRSRGDNAFGLQA